LFFTQKIPPKTAEDFIDKDLYKKVRGITFKSITISLEDVSNEGDFGIVLTS